MNQSNDQTFVIKILDDLRSKNRHNTLSMQYDTSMGLSSNDTLLLSKKRRRSHSPDLEESILSKLKYINIMTDSTIKKNYTQLFFYFVSAPITSPWESRHIKQELINARAEIASLQERNKTLFNLKKESDLLFEKEKVALGHTINKLQITVCKISGVFFSIEIFRFYFNYFRLVN